MAFSEEIIEKIKDNNDIVDVISESVKLKRTGRNYSGLCPFHSEKTPSFSVSSEKQFYKCFGCGEGGNVITFVMKTRNLPFQEAIKYLADRAHIEIEEESPEKKRFYEQKDLLYRINTEAARFFFRNLTLNKEVKEYLQKRGISEKTIRTFGLGYSLDSWDALLRYLKAMKFREEDIVNSGLATRNKDGKVYDRFRKRIMFPVFDVRGKVIGFGARVLDDSKPKYLNSPETPIFHKGTNLYGLNFAIKENKGRTFIIVEGYMDLISLYQSGITNVVASLGTALTKVQAKLLRRYGEEILISYDADTAGQAATLRGLEILREEGFDVRVIRIPEGKDPDDYIRKHSQEDFLELTRKALPLIDYRIEESKQGLNLNAEEDKIAFARKVTEILKELDPIEKDVYVRHVSEDTGISENALMDMIKGNRSRGGPEEPDRRDSGIREAERRESPTFMEPAHVKAERNLLRILSDGNLVLKERMRPADLILESHKRIFEAIMSYEGERDGIRPFVESRCTDVESSKEWAIITQLIEIPSDIDLDVLIDDYLKTIRHFELEIKKKLMRKKIKEYEEKGLLKESLELAKELIELQKTLGR